MNRQITNWTQRDTLADAVCEWILGQATDPKGNTSYQRIEDEFMAFATELENKVFGIVLTVPKDGA